MLGINKIILLGQIIQDIQVRTTSSEKRIAHTLVAVPFRAKDKSTGDYKDMYQYVKVKFFNALALKAQVVVKRGKDLYIEGYLQSNLNPALPNLYELEVVVKEFQVIYKKENAEMSKQLKNPFDNSHIRLCGDENYDENCGNR